MISLLPKRIRNFSLKIVKIITIAFISADSSDIVGPGPYSERSANFYSSLDKSYWIDAGLALLSSRLVLTHMVVQRRSLLRKRMPLSLENDHLK